jgi:membrane protein
MMGLTQKTDVSGAAQAAEGLPRIGALAGPNGPWARAAAFDASALASRAREWLKDVGRFAAYAVRRFMGDRGVETAAALTFTSLLSLVPVLAIAFSVIATFPVFSNFKADMQAFVFAHVLPESVAAAQGYLDSFVAKAGRMTMVGTIVLAVTAVLLLATIEGAFNRIWRVRERRPLRIRLAAYWAILTLGPIFFGLSLSLSGYVFAAARASGFDDVAGWMARLVSLAPLLLTFIGFNLVYVALPNKSVRWTHGIAGAAVAAILFELLKRGFAVYIASFPTYQAIYGAMSLVPILLVWTYASWIVVIFGAVVTASMPGWRARARAAVEGPAPPGRRLAMALALLAELRAASREGKVLGRERLLRAVAASPDEAEAVLDLLAARQFTARIGRDRWLLARDLDAVSLHDLALTLGLGILGEGSNLAGAQPWQRRLTEILGELDDHQRQTLALAVDRLLSAGDKPVAVTPPRAAG